MVGPELGLRVEGDAVLGQGHVVVLALAATHHDLRVGENEGSVTPPDSWQCGHQWLSQQSLTGIKILVMMMLVMMILVMMMLVMMILVMLVNHENKNETHTVEVAPLAVSPPSTSTEPIFPSWNSPNKPATKGSTLGITACMQWQQSPFDLV